MRTRFPCGLLAAGLALFALGCSSKPSSPFATIKKGAYVRVIDLSTAGIQSDVDGYTVQAVRPGGPAATFILVPPGEAVVTAKGSGKTVTENLNLESSTTYTFVVLDEGTGLKMVTVEGDPRSADGQASTIVVVNLTSGKAEFKIGDAVQSVDSGKRSDPMNVSSGSKLALLNPKGADEATIDLRPGKTGAAFAYQGPDGPAMAWFITNPDMQVSVTGASPVQ